MIDSKAGKANCRSNLMNLAQMQNISPQRKKEYHDFESISTFFFNKR